MSERKVKVWAQRTRFDESAKFVGMYGFDQLPSVFERLQRKQYARIVSIELPRAAQEGED